MKIAILSGGKWGTTLSVLYAHKYPDSKVKFWIRAESKYRDQPLVEYIKTNRVNPKRFLDIKVPNNVFVSSDIKSVVNDVDIVLSAIPSEYLKEHLPKLKGLNFKQFVNCSKGIVDDKPISFYFKSLLAGVPYATISGPNIANEIIANFNDRGKINPSFATIAFDNENAIQDLVSILDFKPYFILDPHNDIKSVEYCGILKQVYALALGICVGLGYSGNTIAGLFHACGREIKKLLAFLNANPNVYDETYAGYPDLEVTYKFARHGRTGKLIAEHGLNAAKEEMKGECIEGFRVLESMYKLTNDLIHLPILKWLYSIIYQEDDIKPISELVNSF
ncbi:hypothetical protein DRJ17_00490 [Candidatus Woesearchaeota archaeon]|nr:MAG: hypothetical protein DRJ17_00490 [Candidatus Woesearchaeota archaeon]